MAAMQAIYPNNLLFSAQDIRYGASILFMIGKSIFLLNFWYSGIMYCFLGI